MQADRLDHSVGTAAMALVPRVQVVTRAPSEYKPPPACRPSAACLGRNSLPDMPSHQIIRNLVELVPVVLNIYLLVAAVNELLDSAEVINNYLGDLDESSFLFVVFLLDLWK